jgi:hypothetical protein
MSPHNKLLSQSDADHAKWWTFAANENNCINIYTPTHTQLPLMRVHLPFILLMLSWDTHVFLMLLIPINNANVIEGASNLLMTMRYVISTM